MDISVQYPPQWTRPHRLTRPAAPNPMTWPVGGPIRMSTLTVECPHCYSDVLPMADGRCPSCLADTRAPSAEGGCFTKASLQHQAQGLPSVCIVCGMLTRRKTRFSQKAKNERYVANPAQGGGGIGLLLAWLFDYVSGKMHQEIVLEVPQCEECHQRGRCPRVKHLDFDRRIATFIVHRSFRRALESPSSS